MSSLDDWSHRILLATELEKLNKEPSQAFNLTLSAWSARHRVAYKNLGMPDEIDAGRDFRSKHRKALAAATNEVHFSASLLTFIHISNILLQFDTLLCSSTGLVMRAPEHLLLHADRLDYCNLYRPLREQSEFSNYYELFDRGSFDGKDVGARFCFIEPATGMIARKNNSHSLFSLSSNFLWYAGDTDAFYRRSVAPYLDFSLVWNPDNFPIDTEEILRSLGYLEPHWDTSNMEEGLDDKKPKKSKRGAKPTGAREEYYRRYPDGKPDDISFDAISAELAEAGKPISSRQVQNYERDRSK